MTEFIRSADPMVLLVGVLLSGTALCGLMAVVAGGPDRSAGGLWAATGALLALTFIVAILVVIF
ncbi:hypothetical protein [Brachybacterium tyrofermentans]|uniref:hypothetical protein n=1 Tax=Brachybacterium tyrofermentans TaxID=47848 RepID=UPI003FD5CB40